ISLSYCPVIMDRILEIGNTLYDVASDKINNFNYNEKKEYLTECVGNIIGYNLGNVHELNGKRFTEKTKIAEGGFGIVYLVVDDLNREYALKRLFVLERDRLQYTKNEIEIMTSLKHNRNIVRMFDHTIRRNGNKRESEVLMLLEYCSGGSVLDIMNKRGQRQGLSEREILSIFSDVCNAVCDLHSQNPPIAHRDLKIENVLYCQRNGCYKLCDFGSATTKVFSTETERDRSNTEDDINTFTTLQYRAPEMVDLFRKQDITEKVDIWALGCLLFKMAFYVDPFETGLAILNHNLRIPNNSKFSKEFHDLIEALLIDDPVRRPNIHDVLDMLDAMRSGDGGHRRERSSNCSRNDRDRQVPGRESRNSPNPPTSFVAEGPSSSSTGQKKNLYDMLQWSDGDSPKQQLQQHQNKSTQKPPAQASPNLFDDDLEWTPQPVQNSGQQVPQQQYQQHNNFNNLNNSNNKGLDCHNNSNSSSTTKTTGTTTRMFHRRETTSKDQTPTSIPMFHNRVVAVQTTIRDQTTMST
ncbi:hypothetical protein SAMD00019534_016230, partial [Acytostelium subglobosum LB1]|uniref:hypothetical protein n=1 Tax=Acytostelium subglobosum LB1 TaxID=1410327 RepID=UPI000644DDC6